MKPILDWSAYKDAGMGDAYADIPKSGDNFARAVAVCINSRQCEKKGKGVMCPSFRVSDDPELSPGGRVRLLKQALNGELSLADRALAETMDLCLACKGCKRECENEVDMAMIKIEYLAQRYLTTSASLRTRLFAAMPLLLSRYPLLKKIIVWRNRSPQLAKLGELLFAVDAGASLPEASGQSFAQQSAQTGTNSASHSFHGEVVLLLDTFTKHFAPEHIKAAEQVLNRAGYRVFIAEAEAGEVSLCCGRTQLAHGLVEEAKANARRMIAALLPHVQAGRTVIGLEPACLLAVRDDYRFLGLGETAETVANAALLFEEFIAREAMAGRFKIAFQPSTAAEPLLIHGHCHQKAVGAMKSMRRVLKMIPDLKFEMIDSTCCGMAGSFGIEKEHAALGRAMAEESLLPALRAQPDSAIIANGFSCRHQIKSCEKRNAKHLALLLSEQLPDGQLP
ncbi:MAG: ferredoxin [Zetaproteobacteria bacterium CG02_land_8_20_14_3_00_50_9]|nr:MAG: ferredoxin [Zetaproteobacteria bacterium CG17_big_fil_post_rev_8_21_14_2_50_50_13]PIV31346.1 MAG: ferredoxin [Zetaproteobacteria bacterium CG02_land_8_20_14_3_00_50_9]PIY56464.1 MAG: ferredoxin [Zetaproteobacteria bacterium CG_4_10_14_0_8_um_filter_49_80]